MQSFLQLLLRSEFPELGSRSECHKAGNIGDQPPCALDEFS